METKKTPNANIEKRRPLFLAVGAIVALSFSLVAFEWRTFYAIDNTIITEPIYKGDPDDPLPPITTIEEKTKPKPPTPPVAPPDPFKPEPEPDPVDPSPEPEPDPTPYDPAPWTKVIDEPKPVIEEPEPDPLKWVQKRARYNCLAEDIAEPEMLKEISSRIKYPWQAREIGIQGTLQVRFVVSKTGEVSDVEVISRKLGYGCEDEAIRVVKEMETWCPAIHNGEAVASYYVLPIRFTLR